MINEEIRDPQVRLIDENGSQLGIVSIREAQSGLLMDRFGMTALFPYAAAFVALAFLTMLPVRHGDSRPLPAGGLESLGGADG